MELEMKRIFDYLKRSLTMDFHSEYYEDEDPKIVCKIYLIDPETGHKEEIISEEAWLER